MSTVVFIEFAATVFVYLAADVLRQQLSTQSGLQVHSASEGELSRFTSVEDFQHHELREEMILLNS